MRCYFCGATTGLNMHHIFGGAYRNKSTRYGLIVPLCAVGCHNYGKDSIHSGYTQLAHDRRIQLHQYGQRKAMQEQGWTVEQFRAEFGKNYLEVDDESL